MKSDIKKLWVEALRSGDYDQGRQALKVEGGGHTYHCCLGVLCELYEQETGQVLNWQIDTDRVSYGYAIAEPGALGSRKWGVAPPSVQQWAGLSEGSPTLDLDHAPDGVMDGELFHSPDVAQLNDEFKLNFKQIADWIEASL